MSAKDTILEYIKQLVDGNAGDAMDLEGLETSERLRLSQLKALWDIRGIRLEDRSKAAAQLHADRNRLQSTNQRLMDRLDTQRQSIETIREERDRLYGELESANILIARYSEALEVYADEGNWRDNPDPACWPQEWLPKEEHWPPVEESCYGAAFHWPRGPQIAQRAFEGDEPIDRFSQAREFVSDLGRPSYGSVSDEGYKRAQDALNREMSRRLDEASITGGGGHTDAELRRALRTLAKYFDLPGGDECSVCGEPTGEPGLDCCAPKAFEGMNLDMGYSEFWLTCDVCGCEYTDDHDACPGCAEIQRAEDEEAEWIAEHSTRNGDNSTPDGYGGWFYRTRWASREELEKMFPSGDCALHRRPNPCPDCIAAIDRLNDLNARREKVRQRLGKVFLRALPEIYLYDYDGNPIGAHPIAHIAIQIQDERGGEG